MCGCGSGDSGCAECGICRTCAAAAAVEEAGDGEDSQDQAVAASIAAAALGGNGVEISAELRDFYRLNILGQPGAGNHPHPPPLPPGQDGSPQGPKALGSGAGLQGHPAVYREKLRMRKLRMLSMHRRQRRYTEKEKQAGQPGVEQEQEMPGSPYQVWPQSQCRISQFKNDFPLPDTVSFI